MSYVELIVVLSIFSILSSVAIYNYGDFQANVDIRNLASDIALQIVTAQKSSLNGVLPLSGYDASWKPSYGVYFNSSPLVDTDTIPFNKKFIYFVDLGTLDTSTGKNNQNSLYDGVSSCSGECQNKITIARGDFIEKIEKCDGNNNCTETTTPLSIIFKRPDSSAIFAGANVSGSDYIKITIKSPKGNISFIRAYPSGRVQIN